MPAEGAEVELRRGRRTERSAAGRNALVILSHLGFCSGGDSLCISNGCVIALADDAIVRAAARGIVSHGRLRCGNESATIVKVVSSKRIIAVGKFLRGARHWHRRCPRCCCSPLRQSRRRGARGGCRLGLLRLSCKCREGLLGSRLPFRCIKLGLERRAIGLDEWGNNLQRLRRGGRWRRKGDREDSGRRGSGCGGLELGRDRRGRGMKQGGSFAGNAPSSAWVGRLLRRALPVLVESRRDGRRCDRACIEVRLLLRQGRCCCNLGGMRGDWQVMGSGRKHLFGACAVRPSCVTGFGLWATRARREHGDEDGLDGGEWGTGGRLSREQRTDGLHLCECRRRASAEEVTDSRCPRGAPHLAGCPKGCPRRAGVRADHAMQVHVPTSGARSGGFSLGELLTTRLSLCGSRFVGGNRCDDLLFQLRRLCLRSLEGVARSGNRSQRPLEGNFERLRARQVGTRSHDLPIDSRQRLAAMRVGGERRPRLQESIQLAFEWLDSDHRWRRCGSGRRRRGGSGRRANKSRDHERRGDWRRRKVWYPMLPDCCPSEAQRR